MAVGAQAGATLGLGPKKWGPTPSTSSVIYKTTLASGCASSGTPQITPAISARALQAEGASTTTLTTTDTYTATQCLSTGLLNCPISLQTTLQQTVVSTTVVSYTGSPPTAYPTSISNTSVTAIPFGTSSHALTTETGKSSTGSLDDSTHGASNKLVLGLCLGLGLPIVLGIGVGIL